MNFCVLLRHNNVIQLLNFQLEILSLFVIVLSKLDRNMGVVDYSEATEYVLQRLGVCKINFRKIVILLLASCYAFDIVSWISVSSNVWAITINCLFLLSVFIGSLGVAISNFIALIIFTITTLLTTIGSLITVILIATETIDSSSIGSNLNLSSTVVLFSLFAVFQAIFTFVLLNVMKSIKIYATSGSIYMNFIDDFDF